MLCSISRRMRIYLVDLGNGNGNVRSYRALGSASGSGASCEHVTYRVRERRSTDLAAHAERTFRPSSGLPALPQPLCRPTPAAAARSNKMQQQPPPLATRAATCRAWLCRGWQTFSAGDQTNKWTSSSSGAAAAAATKVEAGQSMPAKRSCSLCLSLGLATLCG